MSCPYCLSASTSKRKHRTHDLWIKSLMFNEFSTLQLLIRQKLTQYFRLSQME